MKASPDRSTACGLRIIKRNLPCLSAVSGLFLLAVDIFLGSLPSGPSVDVHFFSFLFLFLIVLSRNPYFSFFIFLV